MSTEKLTNGQRVENFMAREHKLHGRVKFTTREITTGVNSVPGVKRMTTTQVTGAIQHLKDKGRVTDIGNVPATPDNKLHGRLGKYWALQKVLDLATDPKLEPKPKTVTDVAEVKQGEVFVEGEKKEMTRNSNTDSASLPKPFPPSGQFIHGNPVAQLHKNTNELSNVNIRLNDLHEVLVRLSGDYRVSNEINQTVNTALRNVDNRLVTIKDLYLTLHDMVKDVAANNKPKNEIEAYRDAFQDGIKFAIENGLTGK